mmetsp:Transcript_5745/g.16949  ORF Transcript_5745/g.16949 Transcript_5745/m.16949 type:complete len:348 (-) Transcript_5745:66-1109(-)
MAAAGERWWQFRCPCGAGEGVEMYDDGLDMVECAICTDWAHTACARARLRGFRGASGRAAMAPCVYKCERCAPSRYRPAGFVEEAGRPPRPALAEGDGLVLAATGHPALPSLLVRRDAACRDRTIVREVVLGGCYERPCDGFEIMPGETWLDVGAHIGAFSTVALAAGADVVAVEPDPDNFRVLERNATCRFQLDPCPGQFHPVRAAIVDAAAGETTTLYKHPRGIAFRHSTERGRMARAGWSEVEVPATTLPALLAKYPACEGVKVDIQGAEIVAVESVTDWGRVRKLVLEYDFEYAPSLRRFHEFVARLRAHFPCIYHSKQKRTGNFTGFPNGVLVFAWHPREII